MTDADRIASILGEWLEGRDRGETVDSGAVIAAHPDLAEELRRRFQALSLLEETGDDDSRLRSLPDRRYGEFKVAGEGGMGIVYWALDTDLSRQVALKIVRPTSAARGRLRRCRSG